MQPPGMGTVPGEQEVAQPLPDNAEKELWSYEANSSGGIPLLYACILGYPAVGYPISPVGASPEDCKSLVSLVSYLSELQRCYG